MTETTLKQTALHQRHVSMRARMMPFAGFDMPVQYSGIIDEHMAVRNAAGIFDVSHMGEFRFTGSDAAKTLQGLVTNNVDAMYNGRAMYTVMCLPNGGIIDDLILYRESEDNFLMVVNAANIEKDYAWIEEHLTGDTTLRNESENVALMAIQGPKAIEIVQRLTDLPLADLKFYHFLNAPAGEFFGCEWAIIAATGYTGERGLEVYCPPEKAADIWDAVIEAGRADGLLPAGLGARDTLRLEAGFCLYGNDITDQTNPIEAGLGWITKLDKGDFIGREAIACVKEDGPERKLVAFKMIDRGIPRQGYDILDSDGAQIGIVTSGTQSPILQCGIGLGYVPNDPAFTAAGSAIHISIRSRQLTAEVAKAPLHKS
ncbi:MAG: glycine cleavage system aminomethyltransferase GcvT [Rhodothermia bacterium]|nr:glycine cleavage system aminomethyltransferase GcvT [Rhodothermia bacterium]